MSLSIALLGQLGSARADETPPTPLMTRALRFNGYDEPSRRDAVWAAQWVPELRVHAIVERNSDRLWHDDTRLMGELAWPLGRHPVDDSVADEQLRRQTSQGRQRLLDHIASAWRRLQHARDFRDELSRELERQESQAELDVLTGDGERGP